MKATSLNWLAKRFKTGAAGSSTNLPPDAARKRKYMIMRDPFHAHVTELTLEHLRGWTALEKLLAEVQGEFWKGGDPPSPGVRRTG
jgi:hypothetical protein